MEAKRTGSRWTYSEFARLPSAGGTRHEIIDGELTVTPAPALRHQRTVTRLVGVLLEVVERGLGEVFAGPVDVLFAEGDYLEPDLLFVSEARAGILSDRGVEGAPDLVIEVASPSTADRDRGIKLERYRHYGVPEYWIVDPDAATIERWRLGSTAEPEILGPGDVLRWEPADAEEALSIDVGEILRE